MSPEVVITGIGMVTPAGLTAESTWRGLLAGGRFVATAGGLDASPGIAGQVPHFTPPRGSEFHDRVCQLAIAAADQAMAAAGIDPSALHSLASTAICVGTSKGGILSFSQIAAEWLGSARKRGAARIPEDGDVAAWRDRLISIPPDAPARCIAERFRIAGEIHADVAACSTGTLSVIRGYQLIRDGRVDLVLAGSSDASVHPLWFAAFERMGVLAAAHRDLGPAWACRPFDRLRSGFVIGEGAAVLVLESADSARRRGAVPLARIAGAARATDPAGLTQLAASGEPLSWAIQMALSQAGRRPEDLSCIQAHGTGTAANDAVEARAIQTALREVATSLPVISLKGAIGHLLGAAGAVELGIAAMSCRERISPGTATLIEPDPEFGILKLPTASFAMRSGPILKTSLGFGGHVAAVLIASV